MAGVPNVEMHLYGNGRHPGDTLPDGGRMSGGLTDRNGIPFGTWQYRFIDWARDLGFLQKPGVETKAAKDVATFVANPTPSLRTGTRRRRPTRAAASKTRSRPAPPGPALEVDSTTLRVTVFRCRPWRSVVRGSACPARYRPHSRGTPRIAWSSRLGYN